MCPAAYTSVNSPSVTLTSSNPDLPDLVVVGSGFFGLTIAERAATELGLKVAGA